MLGFLKRFHLANVVLNAGRAKCAIVLDAKLFQCDRFRQHSLRGLGFSIVINNKVGGAMKGVGTAYSS